MIEHTIYKEFIDKISEESKLLLGDYVKNGKE